MRTFFRRQATHFMWGFTLALLGTVAWDLGLDKLGRYAAISAAVGVVVAAGVFFLERRFPDKPATPQD